MSHPYKRVESTTARASCSVRIQGPFTVIDTDDERIRLTYIFDDNMSCMGSIDSMPGLTAQSDGSVDSTVQNVFD